MLHTTFAKPVESARVAPVNALPAGTRLQEFEVRSVIGEGGFGIVYRAFDTALEREVAIKEYLPVSHASRRGDGTVMASSERQRETFEKGLRCFVSEARMLARFKHRALVEILRFWEEKGTAYMVMPYYEGRPLSQLVQQGFRIQDTEAMLSFLNPLLDGLAMLHATDCYHRDISTDNILVLEDGSPLLLDFGAARRILVDESEVLTIILKPGFAPIEQYSDDHELAPQGAWTDLYALAAVAYQLVTGTMPMVSVGRIIRDPLVPLAACAPEGLSRGLVAAIDAGLRVSPDQRPQSVAAFLKLIDSDDSGNMPRQPASASVPAIDPLALFDASVIEGSQASGTDSERNAGHGGAMRSPLSLGKHHDTMEDELPESRPDPDAHSVTRWRIAGGLAAVLSVLLLLGLGAYGLMGGDSAETIGADDGAAPGQRIAAAETPELDPAQLSSRPQAQESLTAGGPAEAMVMEPEVGPVGPQPTEPVWSPTSTDIQVVIDAARMADIEATVGVEALQTPIEPAGVVVLQPNDEPSGLPALEHDAGIGSSPSALALAPEINDPRMEDAGVPAESAGAAPTMPAEGIAATGTAPVPEAIRPGVVDIRVEPWGNVFVNGELVGVAPPRVRFEAQPGQIQVEIRNETHAPRQITIDVEAGRTYRIRHEFGKD